MNENVSAQILSNLNYKLRVYKSFINVEPILSSNNKLN